MSLGFEDIDRLQDMLVKGHIAARDVIKSIQPDLPLGVSIAIFDDQEAEAGSVIDQVRRGTLRALARGCER